MPWCSVGFNVSMVTFKTRKKDGRVFASSENNEKVNMSPMFTNSPKGVRAKLRGLRGKIERVREERLLKKSAEQEERLKIIEERLAVRLEAEAGKAERRERVLKVTQRLAEAKARENEAKRKLAEFTIKGIAKRRASVAITEARRRFQTKTSRDRRKKLFKLGKKLLAGKPTRKTRKVAKR